MTILEHSATLMIAQPKAMSRTLLDVTVRLQALWGVATAVVLSVAGVVYTPNTIVFLLLGIPVIGFIFVVTFPVTLGFAFVIDRLASRSYWFGGLAVAVFAIIAGFAGGQTFAAADPGMATLLFAAEGAAFGYFLLRLRGRLDRAA